MTSASNFGTGPLHGLLAAVLLALAGGLTGLCGGFWGVGGGWIIVPILMLLDVPAHLAVGCAAVHMAVSSLYPAAMRWHEMEWRGGGLGWRVGLPMTLGGMVSVVAGVYFVGLAKAREAAPLAIGFGYVVLLAAILLRSVIGQLRRRPAAASLPSGSSVLCCPLGAIGLGLAGGMLTGLLGVGGGVIARPAMRYIMRLAEAPTAALCQFMVLANSCFAAILHALDGNVPWRVLVPVLAGGVVGQALGTWAHQQLRGDEERDWAELTFAGAAFAMLVGQVLKMTGLAFAGRVWITFAGTVLAGVIAWLAFGLARHKRQGHTPSVQ